MYNFNNEEKRAQVKLVFSIIFSILLFCSLFLNVYLLKSNKEYQKKINKLLTKKQSKIITEDKTKKESEKKRNKYSENIVFLGDSITEYYNLENYYEDDYNYVNSGVGGNQTHDILKDMNNRVYVYNPSQVFLLIGTNDIRYSVEDEKIVDNIVKIIKGIKKNRPRAKIYLESIYPINDTDNDKINNELIDRRTNEEIMKINKNLKKKCKEEEVEYIDLYNELIDEDGNLKLDYTKEGLHISDEGYEKVTEIIKKYI